MHIVNRSRVKAGKTVTRYDNMYKTVENSRDQDNNSRGFDWLPGFKEMMACQENRQEKNDPIEPYIWW